jgi:hypothetical protein
MFGFDGGMEVSNEYKLFGFLRNVTQNVSNWILKTGFWNDNGIWDDTANWID